MSLIADIPIYITDEYDLRRHLSEFVEKHNTDKVILSQDHIKKYFPDYYTTDGTYMIPISLPVRGITSRYALPFREFARDMIRAVELLETTV
jgi:hypothetical protein